jgi:hypothetical protein
MNPTYEVDMSEDVLVIHFSGLWKYPSTTLANLLLDFLSIQGSEDQFPHSLLKECQTNFPTPFRLVVGIGTGETLRFLSTSGSGCGGGEEIESLSSGALSDV